ncbi:MAG: hypothetical protein Q9208_008594 [Pyrenodesmia sp. 3 TL-2023]
MSHPIPPSPISAPPRSSTVPHNNDQHHIHRLHRSHGHHHHHHNHHRDKPIPQSAILPSTTSSNPFKSDGGSLGDLLSPITSRLELGRHEDARREKGGGERGEKDKEKGGERGEDEEQVKKREKEREEWERRLWGEVETLRRRRGEEVDP